MMRCVTRRVANTTRLASTRLLHVPATHTLSSMAAAAPAIKSVPGTVVQTETAPVPPMSGEDLKAIRNKVVTMFKESVPDHAGGVILVKGANDTQRSNTGA